MTGHISGVVVTAHLGITGISHLQDVLNVATSDALGVLSQSLNLDVSKRAYLPRSLLGEGLHGEVPGLRTDSKRIQNQQTLIRSPLRRTTSFENALLPFLLTIF